MAATPTIMYLKKAYPEINLYFNTRHPLASLKSYGKLWDLLPISGTIAMLLNIHGYLWDNYPIPCNDVVWWERYRALKREGCTLDKRIATCRFFFFNYWCVMEQYIKNKHLYCQTIMYEDLCDNPSRVLQELFSNMNISMENIPFALEAMEKDSQNGLFGKIGGYDNDSLSTTIQVLDKKFEESEIPISIDMTMESLRILLAT